MVLLTFVQVSLTFVQLSRTFVQVSLTFVQLSRTFVQVSLTYFCPGLTYFCPALTYFCPGLTYFCPGLTYFCPGRTFVQVIQIVIKSVIHIVKQTNKQKTHTSFCNTNAVNSLCGASAPWTTPHLISLQCWNNSDSCRNNRQRLV